MQARQARQRLRRPGTAPPFARHTGKQSGAKAGKFNDVAGRNKHDEPARSVGRRERSGGERLVDRRSGVAAGAKASAMLYILILHGLIGGFDVVWNHELKEHLPRRPSAAAEEGLHSARELLFALLFISLAWWQWHGRWVWYIAALVAIETGVTARDAVVEVKTRVLSVTEQLSHVFLFINFGVFLTLLYGQLSAWHGLPAAAAAADYGWVSRVLTALGLTAAAWSVRDTLAAIALGQRARRPAA